MLEHTTKKLDTVQEVKVRKISTYTGLGLTKWEVMTVEQAREYISNNQSVTGAFYWIIKNI